MGKCPFEVFYGRKPKHLERFKPEVKEVENEEAQYLSVEEDIEVESDIEDERYQQMIEEHLESVAFLRAAAHKRDVHLTNLQTKRLQEKRIPSIYSEGDRVLIRAKGSYGKKLSKTRGIPGIVVETDRDFFRYKIQDEAGIKAWHNVEDIVMETAAEEAKKQKIAKETTEFVKKCKCQNPECMRMPAKECSYSMHRFCCREFTKKRGACAINSHNHPEQEWFDHSSQERYQKLLKERQIFEESGKSSWLLHGVEAFITMQAWLLASYKKTQKVDCQQHIKRKSKEHSIIILKKRLRRNN